MANLKEHRRVKDPTAGGKRAAMGPDDEPAAEAAAPGAPSIGRGLEAIAAVVKTLPSGPGVYRMLDRRGKALYVGKARNLKKRVTTYTQLAKLPYRLQRMVAETVQLEVVTTHTEVEALLLESNLIKRLMPRFNVLLRDDKSFPYILITEDHEVPQITKHRGAHSRDGAYFGPFASAGAVNRTITALEKAFLLRSCSDAVYSARTRPCLMFQIKRCSAPCVGRISAPDYAKLVGQAKAFLTGRSRDVQSRLAEEMQGASERLDFESAALIRDRIRALSHIQSHQDINLPGIDDADVIAAHQEAGRTCVQVFFFRAGRNYGNRAYFPSHDRKLDLETVLTSFVAQFYDNKPTPPLILLSHSPADRNLLAEALTQRAERKVRLLVPQRGDKRKLIEHALSNAREALGRRLAESASQRDLLEKLAAALSLESLPERIEVYDNSHLGGTKPYGAMIVAGVEGLMKSSYRKFKIKGAPAPGDDYAMMREVLRRRFERAMKEDPDRSGELWPDLVILDGGRGQLNAGLEVFADLGIADVALVAVAKGPERNAGRERIFLPERQPLLLEPRDPVLYFIQRLRDEAHRFAIGSHRAGRAKAISSSPLDGIPGIGAKRKKALLLHFGSAKAVARAGLADLEQVDGISATVAKRIYEFFQTGG